jgi:hypothetical protein
MVEIIRACRNLIRLELGLCSAITDYTLAVLAGQQHPLQELSVVGCAAITDVGCTSLSKMASLCELDLSFCAEVTGSGAQSIISNCPKLVVLRLEGCDISETFCLRRDGHFWLSM